MKGWMSSSSSRLGPLALTDSPQKAQADIFHSRHLKVEVLCVRALSFKCVSSPTEPWYLHKGALHMSVGESRGRSSNWMALTLHSLKYHIIFSECLCQRVSLRLLLCQLSYTYLGSRATRESWRSSRTDGTL